MSVRWTQSGLVLLFAAIWIGEARGVPRRRPARRAHPRPEMRLDVDSVNDPRTAPTIRMGNSGSAVLRAQILLARAHFSCGEIDAHYGRNFSGAVEAFEQSHSLPSDGVVSEQVWNALNQDSAPAVVRVAITAEDVAGPFFPIPEDMLEKSKLAALNYSSPLEGLAEKFHASPKILQLLNPGVTFDQAGMEIFAPNVATQPPGKAAKIVVSESKRCVLAFDQDEHLLAYYPATIGSYHDPLPIGHWKINGVARNPVFHYNPDLFWDAQEHEKAAIAPGPNNPVGVCWIDLSKPHYGIHGTPEPSQIGKTQSHGCIRLTNWDVTELAEMVRPGTPAILEK